MGHYIIIIFIGHFVLSNILLNKIIIQYIVSKLCIGIGYVILVSMSNRQTL